MKTRVFLKYFVLACGYNSKQFFDIPTFLGMNHFSSLFYFLGRNINPCSTTVNNNKIPLIFLGRNINPCSTTVNNNKIPLNVTPFHSCDESTKLSKCDSSGSNKKHDNSKWNIFSKGLFYCKTIRFTDKRKCQFQLDSSISKKSRSHNHIILIILLR